MIYDLEFGRNGNERTRCCPERLLTRYNLSSLERVTARAPHGRRTGGVPHNPQTKPNNTRGRSATRRTGARWHGRKERSRPDKGAKVLDQFFSQISFVDIFNFCVFLTFTICYTYQLYYVFVVLTRKPKELTAKKNHKFAAVISARNESAVIGDLIHSIKVQNYPSELIDVFVIADNCTDDTARVAREAGAIVFPRSNDKEVGKGYALDYGFQCIRERYADKGYEAYFVFDADNVLDVNYFREMNKTFDNGAKASTSYRNSKNYDSNWISAGYAVWFLREAKFLNQARLTLNTSCAVSGTGFFIAADIIEKNGGWKWHLLTEDIEFSVSCALKGRRIGYCDKAVVYDEQPTTFRAVLGSAAAVVQGLLPGGPGVHPPRAEGLLPRAAWALPATTCS